MKIAVLYNIVEQATDDIPLPDNWSDIIRRFRDAYLAHPAGVEHDLFLCASGSTLSVRSQQLFEGLQYRALSYFGKGWDIGAYQHCAKLLQDYELVLFLNSQAFVVTDGWLRFFVDAYKAHGPGIYGASSSFEVAPHIRTCAFAATPQLLMRYPLRVRSRYDACVFEHSPTNFAQWAIGRGLPVRVVLRSGSHSLAESRRLPEVFRRGTQKELIINDRHSVIYAQAVTADRQYLERSADGEVSVDFCYQSRLKRLLADHPPLQALWRAISVLRR